MSRCMIDLDSIPESNSVPCERRAALCQEICDTLPSDLSIGAPLDLEYPESFRCFHALKETEEYSIMYGFTQKYMQALQSLVRTYEEDPTYLCSLLRYYAYDRLPALREAVHRAEKHITRIARRRIEVQNLAERERASVSEGSDRVFEYLLGPHADKYSISSEATMRALEVIYAHNTKEQTHHQSEAEGHDDEQVVLSFRTACSSLFHEQLIGVSLCSALQRLVTASATPGDSNSDTSGLLELGETALGPLSGALQAWLDWAKEKKKEESSLSPAPSPLNEHPLCLLAEESGAWEAFLLATRRPAAAQAARTVRTVASDEHMLRLQVVATGRSVQDGEKAPTKDKDEGIGMMDAVVATLQERVRATWRSRVALRRLDALSRVAESAAVRAAEALDGYHAALQRTVAEAQLTKAALERAVLVAMGSANKGGLGSEDMPKSVCISFDCPELEDTKK